MTIVPNEGGAPPAPLPAPEPERDPNAVVQPTPASDWIAIGGSIANIVKEKTQLSPLAKLCAGASRAERKLLRASMVDTLFGMLDSDARNVLEKIADDLHRCVLEGTVEQQFISKIAIEIGSRTVPRPLVDAIGERLVKALVTILEVGAPLMRDAAVEALGAIVRIKPELAVHLPQLADPSESASDIVIRYIRRRQRQRLMALAISGIDNSFDQLIAKIGEKSDEDFVHRAQLIRILPAVCRQAGEARSKHVKAESIRVLSEAARLRLIDPAVAPFQESAFQTISVLIDRGEAGVAQFDQDVARAVRHLPPTLVGPVAATNACARATMAIIRTAGRIAAHDHASHCARALRPLFTELVASSGRTPSTWSNPGILEGCLHVLPSLMTHVSDGSWTVAALGAVFGFLNEPPAPTASLASKHRRLCAYRCLRRVLIALMGARQARHRAANTPPDAAAADDARILGSLLAHPTAGNVFNAFHRRSTRSASQQAAGWSSPMILAAAEDDAAIRDGMVASFRNWESMNDGERLMLTRIFANQLHELSHDARQIGWYRVLQQKMDALPGRLDDETHFRVLIDALAKVPDDAAKGADDDVQDFLRHRSRRSGFSLGGSDTSDLPPHILAMNGLATDVAREIDLSRKRAGVDKPFDIAILLYHILLHGPHEELFLHLLPRIEDPDDHRLVQVFAEHVQKVHACARQDGTARDRARHLVDHISELKPKLAEHRQSKLLVQLCLALDFYRDLAYEDSVWNAIRGRNSELPTHRRVTWLATGQLEDNTGGFYRLLRELDSIAAETATEVQPALPPSATPPTGGKRNVAESCHDDCTALYSIVNHYIYLGVGQFADRRTTLESAIATVRRLRERVACHPQLHPPERVMLTTLLDSWEEIFQQTIEWYVETPRRCVEGGDPEGFWRAFASIAVDQQEVQDRDSLSQQVAGFYRSGFFLRIFESRIRQKRGKGPDVALEPGELGLSGAKPPEYEEQRQKFEEYYVDWMASDLDSDHLAWALHRHWKGFRLVHLFMTSFGFCLATISLPFLVATIADVIDTPTSRAFGGIGFFVYAMVLLIVGGVTLTTEAMHNSDGKHDKPEQPRRYRYQSTLPRLLRLIVVPLAVIVDFDHSYHMPMHASNAVILLLMVLALLTTNYIAGLELRQRPSLVKRHDKDTREDEPTYWPVAQIVSVALAHAFALSLIFSIIFEANTVKKLEGETHQSAERSASEEPPPHEVNNAATQSTYVQMRRWFLRRWDNEEMYFFGLLPRHTTFDLGQLLDNKRWLPPGKSLHDSIRTHLVFDYYPTLIITWTSLGLFFGVFLEGFLKGERLRGERR